MGQADRDVLLHAVNNGGVIRRREAIALGMSPRTIDRRVGDGYFLAISRGVLALPGTIQNETSLLHAAVAALDAVASHGSAARLLGLDTIGHTRVAVTVPIRKSNKFHSVEVHQSTDLALEDVTVVSEIPTTNPTRTIIDLASQLRSGHLARVLDQAVRLELTTYAAVSQRLESLARRGKPGVVNLRKLLTERTSGPVATESVMEDLVVDLLRRFDLPEPRSQIRPPWLKHVNGRVDFSYEHERLVIEADSVLWHGSPEAFQADRQRDNAAQLAGWRILRFTWEDITSRPEYVADSVSRALQDSERR